MGDAKTSGLIRGMDDVESFTLRTNFIVPIQVQKVYVKNIITIVPGKYDIQSLVSFIEIEIGNVLFGLTWTKIEYIQERNKVFQTQIVCQSSHRTFQTSFYGYWALTKT